MEIRQPANRSTKVIYISIILHNIRATSVIAKELSVKGPPQKCCRSSQTIWFIKASIIPKTDAIFKTMNDQQIVW